MEFRQSCRSSVFSYPMAISLGFVTISSHSLNHRVTLLSARDGASEDARYASRPSTTVELKRHRRPRRGPSSQRGLCQRRPGKRPKSASLEWTTAWYSIARAAMWASVTRLAPTPAGGQVPAQQRQMLRAGVEGRDMGELEPLLHVVNCLDGRCGALAHTPVREHPHEASRHYPGNPDPLRAVDQAPPTSDVPRRGRALRRCTRRPRGSVRSDHLALRSMKSSTSS